MQDASASSKKPAHKKKKSRRRKTNASITDRDMQIFLYLVVGAATLDQIYYQGFNGALITKHALQKRLCLLVRARILNSRRYYIDGGLFALYSLGMPTISYIFEESNYGIPDIRRTLPSRRNVQHELLVSSVYRVIRIESAAGPFLLCMKKNNAYDPDAARETQKIVHPNLAMELTFYANHALITIDLGISCYDGHSARKFVEEMKRLATPNLLILCITAEAIDSLLSVFGATGDSQLCQKVRFALVSDFLQNGITNASFIDANRRVVPFPR